MLLSFGWFCSAQLSRCRIVSDLVFVWRCGFVWLSWCVRVLGALKVCMGVWFVVFLLFCFIVLV